MSFSDATMSNAITAYGCNCNDCCMAWKLEESLTRKKAMINEVEALSSRLPAAADTADCSSLALDYQTALGRVAALTAELKVADVIIVERNKVMEAIPECPKHGHQCVPHALEWIEQIQCENAILRGFIKGEVDWDKIQLILDKEIKNVT